MLPASQTCSKYFDMYTNILQVLNIINNNMPDNNTNYPVTSEGNPCTMRTRAMNLPPGHSAQNTQTRTNLVKSNSQVGHGFKPGTS